MFSKTSLSITVEINFGSSCRNKRSWLYLPILWLSSRQFLLSVIQKHSQFQIYSRNNIFISLFFDLSVQTPGQNGHQPLFTDIVGGLVPLEVMTYIFSQISPQQSVIIIIDVLDVPNRYFHSGQHPPIIFLVSPWKKTLRDIGEANTLLCTLHLNIQLFALLTVVEEDLLCLVLAIVVFRM